MNEYQEMAAKNWEDLLRLDGKHLPLYPLSNYSF